MAKNNKPFLLNGLTLLMCVCNLFEFSIISNDQSTRTIELIITVLIVTFSFWILLKFNQGANWARHLVLLTCFVALFNLTWMSEMSNTAQIVVIFEAALALFLLYWLNTKSIKIYFRKENIN